MSQTLSHRRSLARNARGQFRKREPDQVREWPDGRTLRRSWIVRAWQWIAMRFGR